MAEAEREVEWNGRLKPAIALETARQLELFET